MTTFVAIHQLQERGGESGRPWPWPPYYWLSLRECDPHAERESEWASARGLELQKSQVMQRRRARCTLSQLGRGGSRVLRLNHENANSNLNSRWLEGPHCYEEEANWAQSKRIILATWKEVATIYRKQALDIQNNYKTDLDIWHRNLGLCQ